MKKQKGITLVALIVTIIILLILAGVSIMQLTESGLFEKAKLAKEKQENAESLEDEILGEYENKIGEYVDSSRDTVSKADYEKLLEKLEEIEEKKSWQYLGSANQGTQCIPGSTYVELSDLGYDEILIIGVGVSKTYSLSLPVHILNELGNRLYYSGAATNSIGIAGLMEISYNSENGVSLNRFYEDDKKTGGTIYFYAK